VYCIHVIGESCNVVGFLNTFGWVVVCISWTIPPTTWINLQTRCCLPLSNYLTGFVVLYRTLSTQSHFYRTWLVSQSLWSLSGEWNTRAFCLPLTHTWTFRYGCLLVLWVYLSDWCVVCCCCCCCCCCCFFHFWALVGKHRGVCRGPVGGSARRGVDSLQQRNVLTSCDRMIVRLFIEMLTLLLLPMMMLLLVLFTIMLLNIF
jgi:hypothetical protein